MENGKLNVLATKCNKNNIKFGAIFYSYYNPLEGMGYFLEGRSV